ncbi:MAG: hypothetical protein ACN4GZ_18265 [Acidimicrobiales bacterium]
MVSRGTVGFHIRRVNADPRSGVVQLHYGFGDEGSGDEEFIERIELSPRPSAEDSERFQSAARLLLLVAGTSYYKSQAPHTVIVEVETTKPERDLVEALYDHGLREFAYTNGLAIPLISRFVWAGEETEPAPGVDDYDDHEIGRPLVPFGGGKDSTVVLSMLDEADPVTVNPTSTHRAVADVLGHELIEIHRGVDRIDELTRNDRFNGHIPITAIVSAICLMAAVRDGYTSVVLANEEAASEPTLISDHPASAGRAINHQWSKGATFEALFDRAVASRAIGVRYFSWLRSVDEADIVRLLSCQPDALGLLVSCNRAFAGRTTGSAQEAPQRWCGECPKCLFTFLMLATRLGPAEMVNIFGHDLLDLPERVDGFRQLWSETKPLECVGERTDAANALLTLATDPRWAEHRVVTELRSSAEAAHALGRWEQLGADDAKLRPRPAPEVFQRRLTEALSP